MDSLLQDLRYAARSLRKSPGFTAAVILIVALGIGATTAIFSVVHAVLLRQLPYTAPDRLAMLWGTPTDGDSSKVVRWTSYLDFVDFREQSTSFEQLAAFRIREVALTGRDAEPTRVDAGVVTPNLFATLEVSPMLGRGLIRDDGLPGATRVVALSHALWRTRFGGDPRILGTAITLDGNRHTVVAIMPPSFRYPSETQLWLPLVPEPLDQERGTHTLSIVGRLKDGVAFAAAGAEVRTIARRLEEQYPEDNFKRSARLEPMHEAIVGSTRPALLVLLGAVTMTLLIGCTNVANLCLARAAAREREFAVRRALGADRSRLVTQSLTESLLLSLVGGSFGLLLAIWCVELLVGAAPQSIPRADEIGIDVTVLAFLLFISALAGLLFGVLPVLHLSRSDGLRSLSAADRLATSGRSRRRFSNALVVSDMAIAVVLVIGAALLITSFWRLRAVDPGFRADRLLTAQLQLPLSRYSKRPQVRRFYEELHERLRETPGVQSVAIAFEHPLSEGWTTSFTLAGREPPPEGQEPEARMRPVAPGYFRTVGMPLLDGRDFDQRDAANAPGVVIINEAFARQHFPGENPVGRRINRAAWWPEMPTSYEIIGVVGNERFRGLRHEADPATYFAFSHFPMSDMYVLVRTTADPEAFAETLRRRVWELDATLPVENVRTMEEILTTSVAEPRFTSSLLSLFAGVALLLAALGIYGVLSHGVTQRTREIGIRMALGAQRRRLLLLVVSDGMALALVGIVLGVGVALLLTRVLSSLLYGVSATDPATFVAVTVFLGAVAMVASVLPARRATRIDPMLALRYE